MGDQNDPPKKEEKDGRSERNSGKISENFHPDCLTQGVIINIEKQSSTDRFQVAAVPWQAVFADECLTL